MEINQNGVGRISGAGVVGLIEGDNKSELVSHRIQFDFVGFGWAFTNVCHTVWANTGTV